MPLWDGGSTPYAWAKQGLVDRLVVTPMWATIEFDMPIDRWKSLIAGADVKIQGFGRSYPPFPDSPLRTYNTLRQTVRGASASLLDLGADGIYLYNYSLIKRYRRLFEHAGHLNYPLLLAEAGHIKTLLARRNVRFDYQDFAAPGQNRKSSFRLTC